MAMYTYSNSSPRQTVKQIAKCPAQISWACNSESPITWPVSSRNEGIPSRNGTRNYGVLESQQGRSRVVPVRLRVATGLATAVSVRAVCVRLRLGKVRLRVVTGLATFGLDLSCPGYESQQDSQPWFRLMLLCGLESRLWVSTRNPSRNHACN